MTQFTCQCGETFELEMSSGLPRNRCPYCRTPLGHQARGSSGPVEIVQPEISPPNSGPDEPPQPLAPFGRRQVPPSSLPVPEAEQHEQAPETGIQLFCSNPAIAELLRHVEPLTRASNPGAPQCPQQSGCDVITCPRAFTCKALPAEGCTRRESVKLGLVCAGIAVVFLVIMFATVPFVGEREREPQWGLLVLMCVGLPLVAFLIPYLLSSMNTRKRIRYQRAIASTANELSLTHLGSTKLADAVGIHALSLKLPGKADQFHLHLVGSVQGRTIVALDFCYTFGALSVMRIGSTAVGSAARAFGREQEITRRPLVVLVAEVCPNVPNFCLTPRRDRFDRRWIKNRLRWPEVATGNQEFHRRYLFVSLDPASAATLFTPEWQARLLQEAPRHIQVVDGQLYVFLSRGESMYPIHHAKAAEELPTTIDIAVEFHKHVSGHNSLL